MVGCEFTGSDEPTYCFRPITKQGLKNLHKYENHGKDNSICLRLFLRALFNHCVRYIPETMAPNVVTLGGFGFVLASYFVMSQYAPNCSEAAPGWVYVFCAFCTWMYQLMDNLDGKQAVRTKSSSPLGELFDHGVDALSVSFAGLTVASTLGFGNGPETFFMLAIGWLPFLAATWEEYHTGALVLGVFNGPIEGILLVVSIQLLTAFVGVAFWWQPVANVFPVVPQSIGQLPMNYLVVLMSAGALVFSVVPNVLSVYNAHVSRGKPFLPSIMHLVPGFLCVLCGYKWMIASPLLYQTHTRMFILSVGIPFGYYVSNMTLAHCTKSPMELFHAILLIPLVGYLNAMTGTPMTPTYIDEPTLLRLLLLSAFVIFAVYAKSVIEQITNELGIYCLKLGKRYNAEKVAAANGSPLASSASVGSVGSLQDVSGSKY